MTCAVCGQEATNLGPNGLCHECLQIDQGIWKSADADEIIDLLAAASDLDEVSEILAAYRPPLDPLDQAILREKLLRAMNGKVKSPAKIADAWMESTPKDDAIVEAQAGILVRLALKHATLFHDASREPYATIRTAGHHENHHIRKRSFSLWLRLLWFARYREKAAHNENEEGGLGGLLGPLTTAASPAPHVQAVRDAIAQLEGLAVFEGNEHQVHVRVAPFGDNHVYVDIGDEDWKAIEITPNGWKVVTDPPVRFVRAPGMLPLPTAIPGGRLFSLRQFVSCTDPDWPLLAGFVASLFIPKGPFAILNLLGEQGSAKTSSARFIRRLVDPYSPLDRGRPRNEHELAIAAEWGWVLSYDNLGSIPDWLSDAFCRISTGGGFGARRLYTDDEERRFDAERLIILNGISDIATRGDLLDRSLVITLPRIAVVRDHAEIEAEFEKAWPSLLGACLDAAATALARRDEVKLSETPRMADFARWATAAEPALGLADGEFLSAYLANREAGHRTAVEADPVAVAIESMIVDKGIWKGTATELLELLEQIVSDHTVRSKEWPKAANALGNRLRRIAPDLRKLGVDINFPSSRTHGRRLTITNRRKDRPDRPDRPETTQEDKQ